MLLVRAVPMSIWVLIAAASVGFGSLAGILGMFIPTTSFLVRTLSDRVEEDSDGVIEALESVGASWLVIMMRGVTVHLYPDFVSAIAMRFEMNVSEAIVLGVVGVAGIGYRLNMAIGTYNFSTAATGIYVTFICMFILEVASNFVVRKIRKESK